MKAAAYFVDQLNTYEAMGCFHVGVNKAGDHSPQNQVEFDELQDVKQEGHVDMEGLDEIQELLPESLAENEEEEEADQEADAGIVVAEVGEDPVQTENYNYLDHTSQNAIT